MPSNKESRLNVDLEFQRLKALHAELFPLAPIDIPAAGRARLTNQYASLFIRLLARQNLYNRKDLYGLRCHVHEYDGLINEGHIAQAAGMMFMKEHYDVNLDQNPDVRPNGQMTKPGPLKGSKAFNQLLAYFKTFLRYHPETRKLESSEMLEAEVLADKPAQDTCPEDAADLAQIRTVYCYEGTQLTDPLHSKVINIGLRLFQTIWKTAPPKHHEILSAWAQSFSADGARKGWAAKLYDSGFRLNENDRSEQIKNITGVLNDHFGFGKSVAKLLANADVRERPSWMSRTLLEHKLNLRDFDNYFERKKKLLARILIEETVAQEIRDHGSSNKEH